MLTWFDKKQLYGPDNCLSFKVRYKSLSILMVFKMVSYIQEMDT